MDTATGGIDRRAASSRVGVDAARSHSPLDGRNTAPSRPKEVLQEQRVRSLDSTQSHIFGAVCDSPGNVCSPGK